MKYYFNSHNYVNYWSGGVSEGKGDQGLFLFRGEGCAMESRRCCRCYSGLGVGQLRKHQQRAEESEGWLTPLTGGEAAQLGLVKS